MHKKPIAAVINFCTNESRFLKASIEQARLFARQIIIPVCDHFFDGTPEKMKELDLIYRSFPDCAFIQYPYIPEKIPRRVFKKISPAHFWHSLSRLLAMQYVEESIETVIFLDADEVPDGRRFSRWLDDSDYHQHVVLKLANYWYFREPIYQAASWEDSIILIQKRALSEQLLLQESERDALYEQLPGPKRRRVTDSHGEPMFHHFSWVRTKEEMLKKVRSWGHRADKNWIELVEKEFEAPFKGTDFIHGYQYKTVPPLFNICLEEASFQPIAAKPPSLKNISFSQILSCLRTTSLPSWRKYLGLDFNRAFKR
jgi:hypothetical protein